MCLAPESLRPGIRVQDRALHPSLSCQVTELTHPLLSPRTASPKGTCLCGPTAYKGPSSIPAELAVSQRPGFLFPSTFQPSYSQPPPYNQGGYSQGYTAPPPPPPPPPAYNYGSYGGYNPAPYTPPPPPAAQTYPQPSYNQYQQVSPRSREGRMGPHVDVYFQTHVPAYP